MRRFLVCAHDATPAWDCETRTIIRDLAPMLGRRLSLAVVPDWHGEWPLRAHPGFCRLVRESAEELLLHGYYHQRRRGHGPISWLAERSDEMNGQDPEETRRALERGQQVFADVFGEPARTFLAPAWQRGHVRAGEEQGLEHVLGFFSLGSHAGTKIPLTTWTWDCGRWGRLGHAGHGIGSLLHALDRGVPTLAIHPRDLQRGFWPTILGLTEQLLAAGFEPTTPARLIGSTSTSILDAGDREVPA